MIALKDILMEEKSLLISRHSFILFSFFLCSFLSSSSFITQITQDSHYFLSCQFPRAALNISILSFAFLPPSLSSILFLHSLFSLPLILAQPLFSRLPGSCCSLNSLTSCLASRLLLRSHTRFHFQASAAK